MAEEAESNKSKKITLLRRIVSPFTIIRMHRAAFFVWCMFTLIGGLVGVIISIMRHVWFSETPYTFKQALYIETTSGALYTYSIAIVAAVLSGLFVLFAEREKLSYRTLQIPTAALAVFALLFGGVFYALNINPNGAISIPLDKDIVFDWKQFTILAFSLLFSIYTFCLCRIDDHDAEFEEIKDKKYYKNTSVTHDATPNNQPPKKN